MKGSCLCGAVTVEAADNSQVGACHCSMCRRWNGGPAMAIHCGTEAKFDGDEAITTFRSSDWAERAFCSKCGTNLYYRLLHNGDTFVAAGLFDDPSGFRLESEVYVDHKPGFYDFANETAKLTEQQVIDQFMPGN